jgi:serine/threonine-protein kinase
MPLEVAKTSVDAGAKTELAEHLPKRLGRYLLLRRIARGGMGEVFLAATTGVEGAERPVVVKIIRRDHASDPSFIARFLDEARVQSQLQHSGVAQVLEASIDPESGEPFAAVEFVEGKSLGDLRARAVQLGKQLAWADAVAIGSLISEALAHVHEREDAQGRELGIVHRDLSPQNVMIGYAGDVKIIDFGTARGQNRRCHTVSGVVFAKPGYVAPEVANGDSGDAKVDVYALGVMLWELVAGRRFLQGDASAHMAAVARNGKSLPPLAAVTGAPMALDELLLRLTAFERDARPTSRKAAQELAQLLGAAPPLAGGERSIRARTSELLRALFPGEPQTARREFQRLVASAQRALPAEKVEAKTPVEPEIATNAVEMDKEAKLAGEDLAPGDLLAGTRYAVKREIGRGASSVVYEAEHVDLGRVVALKLLSSEASRATEFADRFRREARALSRLYHENLITILDVGVAADGRLFCVMELLDGETLEGFLAREKGADYREALGIVDKALAALEIAHGANLVHRDIKPANLFLADPFGVKVLDFGLAKTDGESQTDARRSACTIFGTPEYMAPEQAASGEVDARADLYAVGCVLYELLTGRLPFVASSSALVLDAKLNGQPEPPRTRAPTRGIPEAVDALVMRALARHANQRFQTAAEMRRAIAAALAVPNRARRVRRALGGAAITVAMLGCAFVMLAGTGRLHWRFLRATSAAPAALAAEAFDEQGGAADDVDFGVVDPTDSWARAERGEDDPDAVAEFAPQPEPEPAFAPGAVAANDSPPAAEKKGPVRAHPRKRKGDVKKTAKAEPKPASSGEAASDDADANTLAKAAKHGHRPKKKSRLAHVDE